MMKKVALAYLGVVAITFCVLSLTALAFGYSPTASPTTEPTAQIDQDTGQIAFMLPAAQPQQISSTNSTSSWEGYAMLAAGMVLIFCGLKFAGLLSTKESPIDDILEKK